MAKPLLSIDVHEAIDEIAKRTKELLRGPRTGFFLNEGKTTAVLQSCGIAILKKRAEYYKSLQSDNSLLWLQWLAEDLDLMTAETCGTLDLMDLDGVAASRVETEIDRSLREEIRRLLDAETEGRKRKTPDSAGSLQSVLDEAFDFATKAGRVDSVAAADAPRRSAANPVAEISQAVAERAGRRKGVVMPILTNKRWKPGRLATEAGISKNSVYRYLDGTRASIRTENRKAIADALDVQPDQLPN